MTGVESATQAGEMVRAVVERGTSAPAAAARRTAEDTDVVPEQGALALARSTVRQAMGRCGFINVAGKILDNFKVFLEGPSFRAEIDDLSPGVLDELVAWVASQLAAKSDEAAQAQAHVPPETAIKLLT